MGKGEGAGMGVGVGMGVGKQVGMGKRVPGSCPSPFTMSLWKNTSFVQNECIHLATDYTVCRLLISKIKGPDPLPRPVF